MSEIEVHFKYLLFVYLFYLFIRELECKTYKSKCNIYLTLCRIGDNMALCTEKNLEVRTWQRIYQLKWQE